MQDPDRHLGAAVEPVAMGRQLQLGLVGGQEPLRFRDCCILAAGQEHGISTTDDSFLSNEPCCFHPFFFLWVHQSR